jgi:7,8-dihydro-6-hydroxymethylpterin-pyrophosphokinase
MTTKQHDAYIESYRDAQESLKAIKTALDVHKKTEANDQQNWGFQDDLSYINCKLDEILTFLVGP